MSQQEEIEKLKQFIAGSRNFEDFIEGSAVNHIRELRKENETLKNTIEYFIPLAKWYCPLLP